MLAQAELYGAERELARVTKIEPADEGFTVWAEAREFHARTVLLAWNSRASAQTVKPSSAGSIFVTRASSRSAP